MVEDAEPPKSLNFRDDHNIIYMQSAYHSGTMIKIFCCAICHVIRAGIYGDYNDILDIMHIQTGFRIK